LQLGDAKYGTAPKSATTGSSSGPDVTRTSRPYLVSSEVRPLDSGTILSNRYEIIALLGFGGMGAVYRAHDRELDRDVALKTIRSDLANDPSIIQRFKHELVLARQVTHRNVIRIYDLGEADGLKYITMEYVEGRDLSTILETQTKLPASEAADLIAQVCEGLAAAHAEGVIHRDLKPSNIMVGKNGRVSVMDFGLARTFGDAGLTQTGALLGTVEYMSPEQARGDKLDARSDIYTVGLIFYELLTGTAPFKTDTAIASLWKRMQTRPAPVHSIDPEIPRALSDIVDRCLEADRDKRYSSVMAVLTDLARWNGKALSRDFAPYPAVASGLAQGGRRVSPLVWIGLAAFIAIVAVLSYFGFHASENTVRAHPPVSLLVTDFENRTKDAIFDSTLEPAMTLALEGAPFISSYSRSEAHKVAVELRPGTTRIDEGLGRLVAVREGLSVVISGVIDGPGTAIRVTIRALDAASGRVLLERTAEVGTKDAVLRHISDLAASVRKMLGDTTPESAQLAAAETYSSSSLEAAHEYAVAQELQWAGKWEQAVSHYEAAVKLDPDMGRAYAGMAVMAANMSQRSTAEENFKLAVAHIERMSEREKLRTRGAYYLFMRDPQKAIAEYAALVKQFPADEAAYGNLALAHFYTRDMTRAVEEGIQAVKLTPKSLLQKNNVALFAAYAGDYASAVKFAGEVIAANPQYVDAYGALAMGQMGQNQVADALQTYERLKTINPRAASMAVTGSADVAAYEGRYSDAVGLLSAGIASDESANNRSSAATKLIAMAEAYLAGGDKTRALDSAQRALTLDKQDSSLFAVGVIYSQAGQANKASAIAEQLESRVEPDPQFYAKLLRGEIALKSGTPAQAIQNFQQAQKLTDSWLGHFGLGRAYLAAEKFVEANFEFETCLKRRGESSAVFLDDVPTFRYLPLLYYYLARSQDGVNSATAVDTYKTFLATRKAEDALSSDAHRRLAAR
jgi:eukaryotic-like serine/threonine-protein kinase